MKTIVCLFCAGFIATSLAETPRSKLRQYSEDCKSESGVSDENLAKAIKHEEVDDPKLKDHGLCIFKKAELINDDGNLQIENIRTAWIQAGNTAEIVEKIITKCAVKKDTPQNTADSFFKCAHEVKTKHAVP